MRRLRLLGLGAVFLGILLLPGWAAADVNDFTVTNFAADETLSRSDPQGELHIVEHINVTFTDNNHGILRAIPDTYKNHSLQMQINRIGSDSGAPTSYTTYGSNSNTVLKIGDPNQTVTGPQEYTIDYTLRNVISFYQGHDELYWDVNGDQWQQPFNTVSVTLHLPSDLKQVKSPVCYTGAYGSTSQDCTITTSDDTVQAATTKPLEPYQTLTYVAGLPKGYFQPAKWYETLGEYSQTLAKFLGPVVVLGGGSLVYWFRRGRDPKGRGVIVPQYDAPAGLKPIAVGAIVDFKVDNRDITATIIDLAIRGYIKIIETKQAQKLRTDKLVYALQQTKTDLSALDNNEKTLLTALFAGQPSDAIIDVTGLKNKLYTTAQTLSKTVEADLTSAGYFRGNPLAASRMLGVLLVIAFFLVFWGGRILGLALCAGLIIGGIIMALCLSAIAARTAQGVAALEHIKGLKLYLNVAEKDRLKKLQGPDAQYAANANEPVKTVDLFEKLLPYAMVLGVEKQWATKFQDIYASPPNWYAGNWTTFNAYYLVGSLNDGIGTAVTSAFSAPSSSGSSGFGGGGFSGGGGGGGGGGGW